MKPGSLIFLEYQLFREVELFVYVLFIIVMIAFR